jgi:hypothetical protein
MWAAPSTPLTSMPGPWASAVHAPPFRCRIERFVAIISADVTGADFKLLLDRRDTLERRHRRWSYVCEDYPDDAGAPVPCDDAARELARAASTDPQR